MTDQYNKVLIVGTLICGATLVVTQIRKRSLTAKIEKTIDERAELIAEFDSNTAKLAASKSEFDNKVFDNKFWNQVTKEE